MDYAERKVGRTICLIQGHHGLGLLQRDLLSRAQAQRCWRAETERQLASPECAPKCAPKVHGVVRAAACRWQSTGMTMAFTGKKTRIPCGI